MLYTCMRMYFIINIMYIALNESKFFAGLNFCRSLKTTNLKFILVTQTLKAIQ